MLGTMMMPSNRPRTVRLAAKCYPSICLAVKRSLSSVGIKNEDSQSTIASPPSETTASTTSTTASTTSTDNNATANATNVTATNASNNTPKRRQPSGTKIRTPITSQNSQSGNSEASRPKASNPLFFKERFEVLLKESHRVAKQPPPPPPTLHEQVQQGGTLAKQLESGGEKLPQSCWVQIENIPPLSSLNAILMGVKTALDTEQGRGILDLDASFQPEQDGILPFVSLDSEEWVLNAKVILSPFGRPTGWHLRFQNRSIVHALLTHAREAPIRCAWKRVGIREGKGVSLEPSSISDPNEAHVSEATLRVENCSDDTFESVLVRFFSRYDLTEEGTSVVQWTGETSDGKKAPRTFLVHFADASWARAALREKQSAVLKGKTLRLAQYPKQML
jgi:hypothetical protein